MRTRTVAIVAGLVGGLGWTAKMVIMAGQGGPDPDSVPESLAFFVGLLGVVVAAAATGAHLARARPLGYRVAAGVALVLVVGLSISLGQAALTALPGESWVQEEAMFGVVGLLAAITASAALLKPTASAPFSAEPDGPSLRR